MSYFSDRYKYGPHFPAGEPLTAAGQVSCFPAVFSNGCYSYFKFLADRTNGRAIVTVFRPSVCTECIVAKRCVLEQKLLLTAYRKSHVRNRLAPK